MVESVASERTVCVWGGGGIFVFGKEYGTYRGRDGIFGSLPRGKGRFKICCKKMGGGSDWLLISVSEWEARYLPGG